MATEEHDVFISYSRADGEFVRDLQEALSARGRRAWVDWQDIAPTAEWMDEIRRAMDSADAVVFVLSPDSAASKVCGEELEHALSSNKKIVPILARAVDAASAPAALARLNWIVTEGGSLDGATDRLVEALDTDLDRVRAHSRLLVRAREWADKGEDSALLLRGSELSDAEVLIGTDAEPRPTSDQTRIVLASRRAATRRQRGAISFVTAALVVAAGLGVFAWTQRGAAIEQRQEAQEQAAIANSRALGAAAISNLEQQPDLAALLSLEALGSAPTTESAQAIHTTVQTTSWVRRVMWGDPRDPIFAVAFSHGKDARVGQYRREHRLVGPGNGRADPGTPGRSQAGPNLGLQP